MSKNNKIPEEVLEKEILDDETRIVQKQRLMSRKIKKHTELYADAIS